MRRAIGLALAAALLAVPAAGQDDNRTIVCTLGGTTPPDADDIVSGPSAIVDMLGIPYGPSDEYLEENPYYDQEALEEMLGGWLPFLDDPPANGVPRADLCDTSISSPSGCSTRS